MVPAVGQGVIAVVCREQDIKNENLAKEITHGSTKQIVECERNFLMALEGNCETPIGANAVYLDDNIIFAATEIGPYAYLANQEEWFLLSGLSAPDQTYWSVDFIPEINTARFGTYGRGIWDFVLDENYDLIIGDVNQDNNINIQDIIIILPVMFY